MPQLTFRLRRLRFPLLGLAHQLGNRRRWRVRLRHHDRERGNHGAAWSTRFISPDNSTSVPGISGIPFNGVFFSTFFGGHETSWGPSREVHSSFSSFSVSTTKS